MGRQPGNAVALVDWGLGIKWVKRFVHIFQDYYLDLYSSSTYINAQGFVSAPL